MKVSQAYQPVICPFCHERIDNKKITIQFPKLLIVEGRDEEGFFDAILEALGLAEIQVIGIGGKTQFRPKLKALVKDPDFSKIASIGIVRDANADPKTAFQSVRDALKAANLPTPKQPLKPEAGPPRINVMLLPSAERSGELEDLCLEAVKNKPIMTCVDQYFNCVKELGLRAPRKLAKAKVATFLSFQEDPGLSVGLSAQKGYWDFKNQAFLRVEQFLSSI